MISSGQQSGPTSVYAADMDGDGDMDVLSASRSDNGVVWYENEAVPGGPVVFSSARVLTTGLSGAFDVSASDLNGDGSKT